MASEDPLRAIYYHGEVVNGNPEGFGTMKYSDGSEFTGMFLDDAPGGLGVLNGIGDGTMFVGNVSGHRPHGFGVFFHRKNELGHQPLTLGNFVHGVPDGFQITLSDIDSAARKDITEFIDGSAVRGMFLDADSPGGLGVLTNKADGTMFVGNVSGNEPHGFGVLFYRKTELGLQPLTLGNFVHGVSDGFQITLSALDRAAQKDIAEVIDGKVAGKGMRTSLGPGHPNPIVPNIFQIIDGEPVFSKEKLLKFGEFPYYNRIGSLGPRNEDS